ncbi:MAG: hypothetical protein R2932_43125 [Caldilineaceae bacterium]
MPEQDLYRNHYRFQTTPHTWVKELPVGTARWGHRHCHGADAPGQHPIATPGTPGPGGPPTATPTTTATPTVPAGNSNGSKLYVPIVRRAAVVNAAAGADRNDTEVSTPTATQTPTPAIEAVSSAPRRRMCNNRFSCR